MTRRDVQAATPHKSFLEKWEPIIKGGRTFHKGAKRMPKTPVSWVPHAKNDVATAAEIARAFERMNGTRSKYHAEPTIVDGIRFASKKEAGRYQELRLLEKAGDIRELELQKRYPLVVNEVKIATYIADFTYESRVVQEMARGRVWHPTTEDCKGVRTPVYRLKKKLMLALYSIEIRES